MSNTRKRLKLSTLKPHPLQPSVFGPTSADETAALAADLRENGQRDPIVVMPPRNRAGLPSRTILDGHRRAQALRMNGETEADVLIRHDLVDADVETVEAEFLRFNSVRRQLHPVDVAKVELRLWEIATARPFGRKRRESKAELRDRLAKRLNMSARNAGRYLRLARTPIEVQRAHRDEHVPLELTQKVFDLVKTDQAEIARRIRNGEPAKDVIAEYVGSQGRRHHKPVQALAAFVKGLSRGLEDLEGRVDTVLGPKLETYRSTLQEAHEVIGRLLANDYQSSDDDDRG